MSLREVKMLAAELAIEDLRRLDEWLHDRLEMLLDEQKEERPRSRREVVEVVQRGTWTYQLEIVRCGKDGCKCGKGQGHGPYWYGYRKEGGRTKSKYIGKTLAKVDQE